ncbi:MAG: TfoX/Sxy family protein [Gordonia sp. (in: high G+C Gram-positive bacteria)]|uniref:TfoX/Sxy family protein n=1 Tax=Gordonia sp. (in: high G+C Gram-positive bacteria) TaxID=84139 RepID=UPI0039E253FC
MPSEAQSSLAERLRELLRGQGEVREVSMFGGRAFMVNDKIAFSAGKGGDLLVRVNADDHGRLCSRDGAAQAVMSGGRVMGPGWISVAPEALDADGLAEWVDVGLDYNRSVTLDR